MSIDLSCYSSHCGECQKIIVSRDRGSICQHIARNVNCNKVRQYHMDGEVIPEDSIEKCDWMVLNDERKAAYLIELKGSDIHKACNQIDGTFEKLHGALDAYQFRFRIVFSSRTQRVNDSKTIRWRDHCIQKRHAVSVKISERKFEEEI